MLNALHQTGHHFVTRTRIGKGVCVLQVSTDSTELKRRHVLPLQHNCVAFSVCLLCHTDQNKNPEYRFLVHSGMRDNCCATRWQHISWLSNSAANCILMCATHCICLLVNSSHGPKWARTSSDFVSAGRQFTWCSTPRIHRWAASCQQQCTLL